MPEDQQLSFGLPIREFLLVGLVAAVVTLLLAGPVRMLALKAGAVAWPRGRDVHVIPTPRWGGLAMFGGIIAGLLLALQLPALRLAYYEGSYEMVGVVVATALLVGVGMLDDRYDLDAITKFAAQVTAGGVLVLYGVQWMMIWIPLGGGGTGISGSMLSLGQGQGVLLTVLLTVGLVNAMNFVDGLDGLAAGIGLIATLATTVFCIGLIGKNGNDPSAFTPALIAVVLAGACLGFLPHNFNPGRIFMGDTGSMLVGVMLAAAVTSASGKLPYSDTTGPGDLLALVAPILVVIGIVFIPALDLLMAVVRRTWAGTSPFSPDKMHLHHRLLQIGHSHRRAVLLAYLWVAVIAFGAVALALVPRTGLVLAATGVALVIAFVASAVPHRSRMRAAAASASHPAPESGSATSTTGGTTVPVAGDVAAPVDPPPAASVDRAGSVPRTPPWPSRAQRSPAAAPVPPATAVPRASSVPPAPAVRPVPRTSPPVRPAPVDGAAPRGPRIGPEPGPGVARDRRPPGVPPGRPTMRVPRSAVPPGRGFRDRPDVPAPELGGPPGGTDHADHPTVPTPSRPPRDDSRD